MGDDVLFQDEGVIDRDDEEDFFDAAAPWEEGRAQEAIEVEASPGDLTFTFLHDFSYAVKDPDKGTVTSRSSLRCRYDRMFRELFFLKFDGSFLLFHNNDHVAEAGEEKVEGRLRELYIQAGVDTWTLRAGRQIVVWGETDGAVINDVVSPRDESEFIFTDIEEARLGQYMVVLDTFTGCGDLSLFVTLKPLGNGLPERGTRYDRAGALSVAEEDPGFSKQEAGFRWKRIFSRFEVSVMAASLLENRGVWVSDGAGGGKRVYGRYSFYGFGGIYTTGAVLFKVDASFKKDLPLQPETALFSEKISRGDVGDAALGLEYDANGRYRLSVELTHRRLFQEDNGLTGMERDRTGIYLQYGKKNRPETREFQYTGYYQFQDRNAFHRAEVFFTLSDEMKLTLDYTLFQIKERKSPLWSMRHEDRVGAEFEYHF